MPRDAPRSVASLWASSFLGCAAFLSLGSLNGGAASASLITELAWLALLGSVPTALILGAAVRANELRPVTLAAFAAVAGLLGLGLSWEHTGFLLSGPRWTQHPDRTLVRCAMSLGIGVASAAGWLWLVAGSRLKSGVLRACWVATSAAAIAALTIAMMRYRAYDFSMAQLVFPGGVLSAALLYVASSRARLRRLTMALAVVGASAGAISRFSPTLTTEGAREVISNSRPGALVTLYVIPHIQRERDRNAGDLECPPASQRIEDAPTGMELGARRNVIVVTVDALRKDVVRRTRGRTAVMPSLAAWAERGVSFENATTTYPATLFAVGSAFTGLSPAELYLSPAMPETIFTLSRQRVDRQLVVLPDAHWFRLPIVVEFLAPGADVHHARSDAAATRKLLSELESAREADESVMAWIHYYAPHAPYVSHPSFPFGRGKRNAYLSEVAYFDRQLGALMQYLDEEGWLTDTLVVFFSDHGEALGERGYYGHHVYLDGWMVDVPLVLWHASLPPAEAAVGASVADVAPTILHFLGLPQRSSLAANSLLTLDRDAVGRATFSEAFPVRGQALFESFRLPALDDATIARRLRAIRTASRGYEPKGAVTLDRYRLIHHRAADASWTYAREADGLARPIEDPTVSEALHRALDRWEDAQLHRIECRLRINAPRPR